MPRFFTLFICSFLFFTSCSLFDREEPVPAYIHIEKIKSSNIADPHPFTDAWIYLDNRFMGVYEVPATFPLLAEGHHTITVKPGIKVNGISSSRDVYPFMVKYDTSFTLVPEKQYELRPKTSYKSGLTTAWYENFESITHDILRTSRSDTSMRFVDSTANSGVRCGAVFLDEVRNNFDAYSGQTMNLPLKVPVFLEMSYKNTNTFSVGLYFYQNGQLQVESIVIIYASAAWKKIYIDLSTTINKTTDDTQFKFALAAVLNQGLTSGYILVDDLRIIY